MAEKLEGTIVLEGLVEGRLPADKKVEERIRSWTKLVRESGLPFSLEVDGNLFSILPDNRPFPAIKMGMDVRDVVVDALEQLLKAFADDPDAQPFSTLRSVEYQKGKEVQSVYLIRTGGKIDCQQRVVDAHTVAPAAPLELRDRLKLLGTGLVVALLLLIISSFFVDYRDLLHHIGEAVSPIKADQYEVENLKYSAFFTVQEKSIERVAGRQILVLHLKRTASYPLNETEYDAVIGPSPSLEQQLVLSTLKQGYVRYEYYDEKGEFVVQGQMRIKELATNEAIQTWVALPPIRPARLVLTY